MCRGMVFMRKGHTRHELDQRQHRCLKLVALSDFQSDMWQAS